MPSQRDGGEPEDSRRAAPAARSRPIEADYTRPYQSHASIGPSCAVAQVKDGKYHVWTHSQGVFPLRQRSRARCCACRTPSITCTHVEGSGCYGHNGADDVALDAALVARATGGRPVKLQWMREDEFGWEPYGSAMVMKMRARLDESEQHRGLAARGVEPSALDAPRQQSAAATCWRAGTSPSRPRTRRPGQHRRSPRAAADRNAVPLYDFPSQKIVLHYITDMPIRTSALRTLGAYANVFALESFMDELAAAAGADPVEFRLRHMKDPRARAVIETCAQKAGWKPRRERRRHARARVRVRQVQEPRLPTVAVVADVAVDRRTGKVRVTQGGRRPWTRASSSTRTA